MQSNGTVEVNNFDVMRLGLKKELSLLSNKLSSTMKNTSKLNINIDHINELIQVIVKLMEVISAIELKPTFKPEINIPEIKHPDVIVPEIKVPDIYVPEPRVTVNQPDVNIDLRGVIDALENLKYLSDRPSKPIAVRMSDGQKFTKAIQQLKESTDQLGVVYAGQSGITADELRTVERESSGISLPMFDYVSRTLSTATQETYIFKTGGSSGTTVATVVVNYTDATLETLSNVTRT